MPQHPERSRDAGWTLARVGDAALVATAGARIDPELNARVLRVAEVIRRGQLRGVRDVVESYCALTVHFDPLRTDLPGLWAEVERTTRTAGRAVPGGAELDGDRPRVVTVPVCYGGQLGPDLLDVARYAGLTEAEVVRRHAAGCYRVYMLGFLPGFAYMGSVVSELAMPRRSTPRLEVPRGSVGIAGRQTGVYPLTAPGGWQLIGRTPLAVLDLEREEPFLFRPGDEVRFEPIDAETFARQSEATGIER